MRKICLTIISACMALCAGAVPAKPGLITVTQADGSELKVRLMGDENFHFYLSEDGYLLKNVDDTFFYADALADGTVVASAFRATTPAERTDADREFLSKVDMRAALGSLERRALSIDKKYMPVVKQNAAKGPQKAQSSDSYGIGLFSGSHFPASGEQKGLVILVEYQDVKMGLGDNAHDYFSRLLNEPGFSSYGATGSAKDFFEESSSGQFRPTFDVYGPVTLPNKRSYYGVNYGGSDRRAAEMVIDACRLLDDEIDFSEYDRDGDGEVDNVFVFYAGRGEASGGPAESVWPHAWYVSAYNGVASLHDGVYVDRYACTNEMQSATTPDGVGTFVHEFSHVMGLPDLYPTTYADSFTPGAWSCMDYGPYNNNGRTPPLYGVFERNALGWLKPTILSEPAFVTLKPIGENEACMVTTSNKNEFFLFENRQKESWDTYIPGHGMLIWHVDYNANVWRNNKVNDTPEHQYVDIEEADGTQTDKSRAGDAFPGTAGISSFTDDTAPSMRTWSGKALNTPITDIAEDADGIITFSVCGGEQFPATNALEAEDVDETSFTARWDAVDGAESYILNVYTKEEAGELTHSCDFSDEEHGWAFSGADYNNSIPSFYGDALPSVYLYNSGSYISSPRLEGGIRLIKFWHKSFSSKGNILVKVRDAAGSWVTVKSILGSRTAANEEIEVDVEGSDGVRFELETSAAVRTYIDDIEIIYGKDIRKESLPGYAELNTGNVTSCAVKGLTKGTTYYYNVKATGDGKTSRVSNEMAVTTKGVSGISDITADGPVFTIEGRTILAPGETIEVYDLAGRLAASARDSATVLPGLYIIRINGRTAKAAIR